MNIKKGGLTMNKLYLIYPKKKGRIAPEIYGHFAEHIGGVFYDGLWVGKDSDVPNIKGFRKDVVEKLKAINPPVIRWPGGCFAETYDWRDGIGEERPVRISWWTYWDKRYEPNAVGTHEFMDFCELVGAKAYFAANLTAMTPMHIRNWMDYCLSPKGSTALAIEREKNGHAEPFDIPFWGVGNENWGGGGSMRPQFYADECRRYATVMNNAFPQAELFACGENSDDFSWTHGTVPSLSEHTTGFAMHYYCNYLDTDAVGFDEEEWDSLILRAQRMQDIINRNWNIICAHGKEDKMKLVIDEWGCWHREGSGPSGGYNLFEQQSTMRDAVITALTLNIFNNNCEKIRMANVAQLCNNLHALFLAGGDKCIVTPTYHVFDMFKGHQGAVAVDLVIDGDEKGKISASASEKDGKILITLANLSATEDATFILEGVGTKLSTSGRATLLYDEDMRAHNTFDNPERVMPTVQQIDLTKPYTLPRTAIAAIEVDILE
jgi:alpha-N-arabinofuranosidase